MTDLFDFCDDESQPLEATLSVEPETGLEKLTTPCAPTSNARANPYKKETASSSKKRQVVQKLGSGNLRRVEARDWHSVDCFVVKAPLLEVEPAPSQPPAKRRHKATRTNHNEVVAFWPQYQLDGGTDSDSRWIIVGWHEHWLNSLSGVLLRGYPSGTLARHITERIREFWIPQFQSALRVQRKNLSCVDSDDNEDNKKPIVNDPKETVDASLRFTFQKHAVMDVVVAGHKLVMLNTLRPCVILLNDAARVFFQSDFVKTWGDMAPSQQEVAPPAKAAPFHFDDQRMPNIRGKVVWTPQTHTWQVDICKPKQHIMPGFDYNGVSLAVQVHLKPEKYGAAKYDAYVRAIITWNSADGSSRRRINAGRRGAECQ